MGSNHCRGPVRTTLTFVAGAQETGGLSLLFAVHCVCAANPVLKSGTPDCRQILRAVLQLHKNHGASHRSLRVALTAYEEAWHVTNVRAISPLAVPGVEDGQVGESQFRAGAVQCTVKIDKVSRELYYTSLLLVSQLFWGCAVGAKRQCGMAAKRLWLFSRVLRTAMYMMGVACDYS